MATKFSWKITPDKRKAWERLKRPDLKRVLTYRTLKSAIGNKHGLGGLFIEEHHAAGNEACIQCDRRLSYGRLAIVNADLKGLNFGLAHHGCAMIRLARAQQWHDALLAYERSITREETRDERESTIDVHSKACKLTRDYLRDLAASIRTVEGDRRDVMAKHFRSIWAYRYSCRIDRYGRPIPPSIDASLADDRPIGSRTREEISEAA